MSTESATERRFRPHWLATLVAGLAFLVLIGLGTWQLQRLAWKSEIIALIDARIGLDPVDLPAAEAIDPPEWRWRPARVTGTFRHDQELHLLANNEAGKSGYQIITPMDRADGGTVLINRGWVPADRRDAATRPEGQIAGTVTVTGLARPAWEQIWSQKLFVPENDIADNLWFWGDLNAMVAHLGLEDAAPVFLDADSTANPGGFPIGGQTVVRIRNEHLQYAITWYALAATLVVIWFIASRRPPETRP